MKIAIFSAQSFDREFLPLMNWEIGHELTFFDTSLRKETAVLAHGYACISCSVGDDLGGETMEALAKNGVRLIALRSAGYNQVDLAAAEKQGIHIVRVPAYSPHAIAEHAVALLLALNRHIPKASNRVRDLNFSLEGLMGFDLHGKTVGVIGTGKIGSVMVKILNGFGCKVIAYDLTEDDQLVRSEMVRYTSLEALYRESDIISLHVPLTPKTHHLIHSESFAQMKKGVYLVNTSRGGLVDTKELISALKSGQVGAAALDVYEEEEGIFYHDLSVGMLKDDVLARLLTFPNVLMTSHQAFFTREAVSNIALTTLLNVSEFESGKTLSHQVRASTHYFPLAAR
ncbi:MAG: 2-hydroxyacid dehydrogenase [Cryobacterium sp.]|nr:2-hydroxyacid dehydrogenase [Oligoflexia bacterium]